MKKPLYFSIALGSLYGPKLVAVTTERSGRWWGRDLRDDLGTHGRRSDLAGRFDTVEAAKAVMQEVDRVSLHFSAQRRKLEEVRGRLRFAEEQMLAKVTSGEPKRGAEMLIVEIEVRS